MNLTCPICGTVFERRGNAQRYCSSRCRYVAGERRRGLDAAMDGVPPTAHDLVDALGRLRYAMGDLKALTVNAEPRVASIAARIVGGIEGVLRKEGL